MTLAILTALAYTTPFADAISAIIHYVRGAGAQGAAIFALLYVLATVLLVPGSALTLAAGFVYGLPGLALVWPAALLGSALAFLLSRSVLRNAVERRLAGHARLLAVNDVLGEDGLQIVLLLRLSPIFPFSVLNYALGLSKVRFRDFMLGSAFGALPGGLMYIYLGSLLTTTAQLLRGDLPSTGVWGQVAFWSGLAATAAVTTLIAHHARKKLRRLIGAPATTQ